jgi:tRNA(fMet)-specific endonuclease VapC
MISVVSEGEIRSLSLQFGWGTGRVGRLHHIVGRFVSLPLEHPGVIDAYGEIDHLSRQLGRSMSKNDVWIAATARATRTRLLTIDLDFDHLSQRNVIMRDWIDPASRL